MLHNLQNSATSVIKSAPDICASSGSKVSKVTLTDVPKGDVELSGSCRQENGIGFRQDLEFSHGIYGSANGLITLIRHSSWQEQLLQISSFFSSESKCHSFLKGRHKTKPIRYNFMEAVS